MKTPDLTPAQLLATAKAAVAVAVAFSVPLSSTQQAALIGLAGALSVVLVAADAAIRRARAQHLAGPIADAGAAAALEQAATAQRRASLTTKIADEAAAEAEAQRANEAAADEPGPADGIDPATL